MIDNSAQNMDRLFKAVSLFDIGRRFMGLGGMNNLGDAGVPGGGSDEWYTGDTGDSQFSLQYYRDKITEFQRTLQAVDLAAQGAYRVLQASPDPDLNAEIEAYLSEYQSQKTQMRLTAEAINGGAALINTLGGRMPVLSIPSGLGLVQFAIPAALIAAVGVAASLVVWGNTWVQGLNQRMKQSNILQAIENPQQRAQVAAGIAEADNAAQLASESSLSGVASAVKWVAIGVVGFLAFKAFMETRKGGE